MCQEQLENVRSLVKYGKEHQRSLLAVNKVRRHTPRLDEKMNHVCEPLPTTSATDVKSLIKKFKH